MLTTLLLRLSLYFKVAFIKIDLFRKYPNIVVDFLVSFESCIQIINNDQKGLSALVFILGEYGEKLENSPYILETLIENLTDVQSSEIIYSVKIS